MQRGKKPAAWASRTISLPRLVLHLEHSRKGAPDVSTGSSDDQAFGNLGWMLEPSCSRPHVFILGAGASREAFLQGDATGKFLPLASELPDACGLQDLCGAMGLDPSARFESELSRYHGQHGRDERLRELEDRIRAYFKALKLPADPTLYDKLVASLRRKDLVATFNWDPLLYLAWSRTERRYGRKDVAKIAYLHGCATLGWCDCGDPEIRRGRVGNDCHGCGKPFRADELVLPITSKRYTSVQLRKAWDLTCSHLAEAYVVTIFGYSMPAEDTEASNSLK